MGRSDLDVIASLRGYKKKKNTWGPAQVTARGRGAAGEAGGQTACSAGHSGGRLVRVYWRWISTLCVCARVCELPVIVLLGGYVSYQYVNIAYVLDSLWVQLGPPKKIC